jgi:glycerol-3-phosphate dehydrogenase
MELATRDPSLLEPLTGAEEYLRVEVAYAATHEAALHLDDVITRRTRISIESPSRGVDSARAAAEIVAPVLGWDEEQTEREIAAYAARVAAEVESQKELEDSEANAERLAAPDVRRIPVSRSTDHT